MNEQAHRDASGRAGSEDGQSIDPVCGMRVDRGTQYRSTLEGREFLFCSERCRERFRANPTQYIKEAASSIASPQIRHSQTAGHPEHVKAGDTRGASQAM